MPRHLTYQSFCNHFKPTVSKMVQDDLTSEEILHSLEENHSVKFSQRMLTRLKEDWGLTHNATQKANHLEETIQKYFDKGLNYNQIYHALPTTHTFTHSKRTLKRKLHQRHLSWRLPDDLDQNFVTFETAVSCIAALLQTPKGQNVGYRRLRQLLQTQYGITLHKEAYVPPSLFPLLVLLCHLSLQPMNFFSALQLP
jgi:hypothetical protein